MATAGIARTVFVTAGSVIILFLAIILLSATGIQKWLGIKDGHFSSGGPKSYSLLKQDYGDHHFSGVDVSNNRTAADLIKSNNKSDVFDDQREQSSLSSLLEYIVPKKLPQTALHQDDILYSSDIQQFEDEISNGNQILPKHHSGHFRPNTAEIWDPHPEYQFNAFGHLFHLVLKHDSNFVIPNLKITDMSGNFSQKFSPDIKPHGCFYSGHLKDIPRSNVVVSLCNGMTGHINTEDEGYFIEPTEQPNSTVDPFLHSIYKVSAGDFAEGTSNAKECGMQEEINDNSIIQDDRFSFDAATPSLLSGETFDDYKESSSVRSDKNVRRKRSTESHSGYVVELMVVVDKKMADYHGTGLHNYVLTLMSIVAKIYKDESIGNPIHISVVKLIVMSNSDFIRPASRSSSTNGINISRLLKDFCDWQATMYKANDPSNVRYDSALLLTREYVCNQQNICDNTLGLARMGTMCQQDSCAVVRDTGLSAAFTIAHELGHVFSMPHDDEYHCSEYRQNGSRPRVMSHVLDQKSHPWTWSICSRHFLTEYLDTANVECLKNGPYTDLLDSSSDNDPLPGENYSPDRQCELTYGFGSRKCSNMEVCKSLWCTKGRTDEGCRTHRMPWADGTPCAHNHWCQRGECVPIDRNSLLPVDGGWGDWQSYGECSRKCGGGVKKSYRECDNPLPRNGGKYCLGKRVRYQSCGTKECPSNEQDFRAHQCAKFNNKNVVHNLKGDITFVPKYGGRDDDRCKLNCRVSHSTEFYTFQQKVIDGTRCGPDTYEMCVNGICQKAGCDHVLSSNMKLDMCGVCGGDNTSCKPIYNTYNSSHYGYNHLVTLPAGSSNLDIRQHGYKNNNKDGNYLALSDPETGEYILNGNFIVSPQRKILRYAGVNIEYSGSNSIVEQINSSIPLNKELVVELLSIGNLDPPDVVYQYTIPKSLGEYFKWEVTDEWTQCDKVCHGEQEKVIRCVKKETGQFVSAESCTELVKPATETRPCNERCVLRWKIITQSECSTLCGQGTRTLTYHCVQEFMHSHTRDSSLPDSSCSHIVKPQEVQPCTGPCDKARWRYHDWQPCSVTCGSGIQTRVAECVDEFGRPTDEYKCTASEKITQQVCNNGKCSEWYTGKWSTCSGECGTGERSRQIWCRKDGRVVFTSLCDFNRKPPETEQCQLPACPYWIAKEWSSCSVTCGIGTITRTVRCSSAQENACPSDHKPATVETCTLPPCSYENEIPDTTYNSGNRKIVSSSIYKWHVSEWDQCSKTCGRGIKMRSIRCYDTGTGKMVDKRYCHNENIPQIIEACYGPPCAAWKTSSWSSCSVTCGEGVSVATLKCASLQTLDELPPNECSNLEKPTTTIPCKAAHSCKSTTASAVPFYNWRIGRWGECSASCGGGMQVRAVECQNQAGEIGHNCRGTKPELTAPCNTQPCPSKYYWKYGEWSKCNQTCDQGYQRRQAICVDELEATVPSSNCVDQPLLVQRCENRPCASYIYKWKTAPWSECSVTCGTGVRRRLVECKRINIGEASEEEENSLAAVNHDYCSDSERPEEQLNCQLKDCLKQPAYYWVPGSWSECDFPCEKRGREKRQLSCYRHPDGRKVHRRHCKSSLHGSSMPIRKRKCERRKCGVFTSCSDVLQKLGRNAMDKEYTLNVAGRNISIYCHDMRTQRPLEFLTLPAGELQNYSEFYEKRLMDPDTCPFNGDRRRDCPCTSDRISDAGQTQFSRIRLNISSLEVVTTDYTFARQLWGKPVAYGEAGDCYSRIKCPQGRFSIDLTGTGLRVSPTTVWAEYKRRPLTFMSTNKFKDGRKVIGTCGGYCGQCKPNESLKLDVLPP